MGGPASGCSVHASCSYRDPWTARSLRENQFLTARDTGRAVPLDRNAKARIAAYARAWSARNKLPGPNIMGRSPWPSGAS